MKGLCLSLCWILAVSQSGAASTILWDNNLMPEGDGWNVTEGVGPAGPFDFIVAEHFELDSSAVVTEFQWVAQTTFTSPAVQDSATVDLWLYPDPSGSGDSQPINGTFLGEHLFESTPTSIPNRGPGFIHLVDDLHITLAPGSNLRPLVTGEMFWAISTGGQGAGTNGWGLYSVVPGTFMRIGNDFAFVIRGETIPEPTSLSIVLLLSAVYGSFRGWRRS